MRLAQSLVVLATEIENRWPEIDMWYRGVGLHSPGASDVKGESVYLSLDIAVVPFTPVFADHLAFAGRNGHKALQFEAFILSDGKITAPHTSWQWREYGGAYGCVDHVHLTISSSQDGYDSEQAWGLLDISDCPGDTRGL